MIDFKKVKFISNKDDKAQADNPQAVQQQKMAAQDVSVSRKLDEIVANALAMSASEIHLEAFADRTRVRVRTQGKLQEIDSLEAKIHTNLVNRVKVLGGMDITKHGVAQKGYFKVDTDERQVELVAVIMPTPLGEKAMIKIHMRQALGLKLDQLGMYPKVLEAARKQLARPNGLLLVAGPPGSGRTTTGYACLQELQSDDKNCATFESNIRFEMPGVIQSKPEERFDFNFLDGLRAAIDMEPDVLYIGEMNDAEAARMALSAAFGKRIVIGRMNATNGATAVLALLDMGIPGFLVAQGVIGVLSQRLVRRLCEQCRQAYQPPDAVLQELGIRTGQQLKFYKAGACEACGQTGFRGQLGLFELFVPSDKVREKIIARAPAAEINAAAAETGFVPLRHDGIRKVSQGLTSLEEVMAKM